MNDGDGLTIGSLFAGVGLLDLAVELATGGSVRWQVERDAWRREILGRHWPDVPRFDDVRTVDADRLERVDLVCGGFPCQDLSLAGKGRGLDGERSGLWREYRRIVEALRPACVFIENVPALERRGLDRVLADLDALGYASRRGRLAARDVGAPHRRERLWILAYSDRNRLTELAERIEAVADADRDGLGGLGEAHDDRDSDAPRDDAPRRRACDFPPGPDGPGWDGWLARNVGCEPGVRRGTHGRAAGMDGPAAAPARPVRDRRRRLAALGDAVCVPQAIAALVGLATA